jgi:hypothetical protein
MVNRRSLLGFDYYSVAALGVMLGVYAVVFGTWRHLIAAQELGDPLLWAIWFVMTILFCWRVRPLQDLKLGVIGAAGGLAIEWWGTTSRAWTYFTNERPPLFIIPAWLVAAVVVNRIATVVEERTAGARAYSLAYWPVLYGFVVWMAFFVRPFAALPSTWVFCAAMVAVPLIAPRPRKDMILFATGAVAGAFFETWGTSRACWTYYTGEVPPAVAVAAHGFGAVAFAHASRVLAQVHSGSGGLLPRGIRARPPRATEVVDDVREFPPEARFQPRDVGALADGGSQRRQGQATQRADVGTALGEPELVVPR